MIHPLISVVTPSYNQAAFLEATLDSIHAPGYPNLEHIVVDGGSTDGSVDILRRYSDRFAYWVSERDEGQTDALIRGFSKATGEIHCWLNSDDLFEPQTLFEVGEIFAADPTLMFIYGDSKWIDAEGRFIKPKREQSWSRFVWLYDHNFIPQPSAFWRSSLYADVGGLDLSYDLAMDADLWVRFSELVRPRHFRRYWSRMRFYPDQKNTAMRAESLEEMTRIRRRYTGLESSGTVRAKALVARAMRVAFKAAAGGYTPSEVRSHRGVLSGQGSWEMIQSQRDDSR